MRWSYSTLATSVFILLLIITSCKKDTDSTFKRTLNIGILIPVTGTAASIGNSSLEAIKLAGEDITQYLQQIGSEYEVNLLIEDTQTDTVLALKKIQSLKARGVQVVIGPWTSSAVKAVKSFADQNQMIVISPASVSTFLSVPGDNIFRLIPDDSHQTVAVDQWFISDTTEIIVPLVRNDAWGKDLYAAFNATFTAHNGILSEPVFFNPSDISFSEELQEVSQHLTDLHQLYPGKKMGVYMISYGEGSKILETAALANFWPGVNWYGSTGYALNSSLFDNFQAGFFALSRNFVIPTFGLDVASQDKWQPLTNRLVDVLGRTPEVYALISYDALWMAVLTYMNTGIPVTTDRLKVAFISLADQYYGVTGRMTLNEAGDRKFAQYDFFSVRYQLNAFMWVKTGWYDNNTGRLERY